MRTLTLKLHLAVIAMLCASIIQAATWTVYNENHKPVKSGREVSGTSEMTPVEQLVYAITNAKSGYDTIVIKPGVYDLSVLTPQSAGDDYGDSYLVIKNKDLTIKGEDESHWSGKTAAQETVLKGGPAARIVYGYAGNGRKSKFVNLVFDGGTAQSGKDGGAIFFGNNGNAGGYATNCVFRNCTAAQGGATYAVDAYDCLFDGNIATVAGGGAAIKSLTLWKCVFCCNSAPAGAAVYKYDKSATNDGIIKDCTFTYNYATNRCGGVYVKSDMLSGTIEGCTFNSNTGAVDKVGGHIANVQNVRGCKFSGKGSVYAKNLENCEFDGCEYAYSGGNPDLYDALVVFDNNIGDGLVRNSLFHGCNVERLFCSGGVRVDVENCTFADNTCSNNIFTALRDGSPLAGGTNVFVNCIFANPAPGKENAPAKDFYATSNQATGCNILSNCLFWSSTGASLASGGEFSAPDLVTANPKFAAGDASYSDAPYYMLRPGSRGHRAGLVDLSWMSVATDLAGNSRLVDGKVDIGCYQSNLRPLGFILLFR